MIEREGEGVCGQQGERGRNEERRHATARKRETETREAAGICHLRPIAIAARIARAVGAGAVVEVEVRAVVV